MKKFIALTVVLLCVSFSSFGQLNTIKKPDNDTITLKEFNQRTGNKNKVVLVYFSADWCLFCAKMKPVFLNIEKAYDKQLELLKIDTTRDKEITEEFEIDALPIIILYKNGHRQWVYIGIIEEKILKEKIELYL